MQINEHAHTPEVRSASCVVVSFTLDLISWLSAEHAVCEPCHLTWSIHLSGEANESYERWVGVSISIGRPESIFDTDRRAEPSTYASTVVTTSHELITWFLRQQLTFFWILDINVQQVRILLRRGQAKLSTKGSICNIMKDWYRKDRKGNGPVVFVERVGGCTWVRVCGYSWRSHNESMGWQSGLYNIKKRALIFDNYWRTPSKYLKRHILESKVSLLLTNHLHMHPYQLTLEWIGLMGESGESNETP